MRAGNAILFPPHFCQNEPLDLVPITMHEDTVTQETAALDESAKCAVSAAIRTGRHRCRSSCSARAS
jgi:hypothetical protein